MKGAILMKVSIIFIFTELTLLQIRFFCGEFAENPIGYGDIYFEYQWLESICQSRSRPSGQGGSIRQFLW
jgi:hypothetical protein